MPPVSQGNRSTLIAWMVVTSILAVVTTTLSVYFYIDSSRVSDKSDQQAKALAEVVTPDMVRGYEMEKLKQAKNDPNRGLNSSMKLMDVALAERNGLAKLINGNEDEAAALTAAHNVTEKAKATGIQPANESLAAIIDALVAEAQARKTEAENNKKDSDTSKTRLGQVVEATDAQIKSMKDALDHVSAERDQAIDASQKAAQTQSMTFDSTAADLRKQLDGAQSQINLLNAANADLGAQMTKKDTELTSLREKLGANRLDAAKMIARQPDGKILRVPGGNKVFINLGDGDHITPGLTFEVYDKIEGVPPPGDPANDQALPIGKASIEVTNVLPTGSECHIVRLTPGAALSEGDLIVNLVYDRNTKYSFVVYGDFDINHTDQANAADAEVIKRLITLWGGKIVNDIDVDTDFVVLGKEPVIPDRPNQDDPLAMAAYNKAVTNADAFAAISQKAREYRLPILNQNRFLYMVGYYNQINR